MVKFEHRVRRAESDVTAEGILDQMLKDEWYIIKYDIDDYRHTIVFQKHDRGFPELEKDSEEIGWNIGLEKTVSPN